MKSQSTMELSKKLVKIANMMEEANNRKGKCELYLRQDNQFTRESHKAQDYISNYPKLVKRLEKRFQDTLYQLSDLNYIGQKVIEDFWYEQLESINDLYPEEVNEFALENESRRIDNMSTSELRREKEEYEANAKKE